MLPLELLTPVLDVVDPTTLPCVQTGPDLFFSESPGELEAAKLLCRPCPVRAQCLAGAVERGEPWGVWGGEVFHLGQPVPFKRPRGRPRKHATPPVPALFGTEAAKAS
ncbi:MAG TPA: WhiB family transcriptional regulator [Actinomycetes bacterium]|nr:WhiB family transcriptional regulator [Actinomycetes bacterium]